MEMVYVFGPAELRAEDFPALPPPQDAVSIRLPTRAHASTAGNTRRAFLKFPTNTKPAMPNEKIQLAYRKPPVRSAELFALVAEFEILRVELAVPLPVLMVAGENEQTRLAGR